MADAGVLKTSVERRKGSNPFRGIRLYFGKEFVMDDTNKLIKWIGDRPWRLY